MPPLPLRADFDAKKTRAAARQSKDGPNGLIDRKAPGKAPLLNADHRKALIAMIESGPTPAIHGVVRWRIVDLCQWLFEEFRVSVSKQTLSRELRALGYRKLSARPRVTTPRNQRRPRPSKKGVCC